MELKENTNLPQCFHDVIENRWQLCVIYAFPQSVTCWYKNSKTELHLLQQHHMLAHSINIYPNLLHLLI